MFAVTLPQSASSNPQNFASRAKKAGADLLEIRMDLTPDVGAFASPLSLIVSLRGGDPDILNRLHPAYVDLEQGEEADIPEGAKVIRSFHDYDGTPDAGELTKIAEELMKTGADIVKIATTVNSYRDVRNLQHLDEALPKEQQRIILGMGIRAHLLRMLSPLRNAITFTCLDVTEASAPGQVPLALLKIVQHCKNPKIFGILGGLNVQSFSPLIHSTFFAAKNVDALFTELLTDDLNDLWSFVAANEIAGLSVTSPYKRDIIEKLDAIDPLAEELQSVNTVVRENGTYKGYNKDAEGFQKGYAFMKDAPSVCILGSGGVVPAIIHACKQLNVKEITICARNQEAIEELKERFDVHTCGLDALNTCEASVIVCAINADIEVDLPPAHAAAHAIDVRYGKRTRFMQIAEDNGYTVHDGVPMLLHQAVAQSTLFAGSPPDSKTVDRVRELILSSSPSSS